MNDFDDLAHRMRSRLWVYVNKVKRKTDPFLSKISKKVDIPSVKMKKHKIRPWDVLVNIAAENLQDAFNETVAETLAEYQNKDIQEAEEMAYEELEPNYISQLISRYKYMVGMTAFFIKERPSPPENNENS